MYKFSAKLAGAPPVMKTPQTEGGGGSEEGLREFDFSPDDFARVKKLIYKHAGISLNDSKQSMVYSRLARRVRSTGKRSFNEYLNQLENHGTDEWEHFVNALTTNLTSFYREAHHFTTLAEFLKQLAKHRGSEKINIWCCAASTGEEPYTIAITAMEAFGSMTPPVHILATDIDTKVLETAQRGVYTEEQIKKIDSALVQRYFLRGNGTNEGRIKVRPQVMNLLSFRRLNLLEDRWSLRPGFDVIFCRNVMIYFDKPTQHGLLQRFAPLLNKNGLLFVGHSENFTQSNVPFRLRGKTVYEVLPAAAHSSGVI